MDRGQRSLENLVNHSFWKDRPVFVTGATGLVGSWLVKRLIEAGAEVVCLVRDWVPQSELVRTGALDRVRVVRGDVRDRETLERSLGEYEIDTVFHLAAQTIVGIANRNFPGAKNIMWSSDYPHSETTYPHSRESIATQFKGVPEADRRQIICERARALFRVGHGPVQQSTDSSGASPGKFPAGPA